MKNKLLVAFLAVVSSIQAATVSEPVTVNSYERSAPALQFYSGNGITIPITLKNGSAAANITNLVPFFSWSPSNASSYIVTAQCSIVNATAGTFNAVFTPQKLNTNGTFIYEAGARDSNGYPVVYRQGVFQIVRSPFSSGVNPVEYVSQIDFSVVLPVNAPWIRTNAPDGVTIIYSNGVLTAIAAAAPDLTARAQITAHTNSLANPHQVTAAQVGAAPASWVAGFSNAPVTWNDTEKTVDVTMPDGTVGQMFQDVYVTIRNTSGYTITNGKAVRAISASGYYSGAALASNTDSFDNVLSVIGIATMDITNNSVGKITLIGNVNDINTSSFIEGSNLWLSATPGELTMSEPSVVVNRRIRMGTCLRSNSTVGRINVAVRMIPEAGDIGAISTSRTVTLNGTVGNLGASNLNFTVAAGSANAVTNGGASVNGQAISNGAAIVLTAGDVGAVATEADPLSVHTTNATYTATVAKAASALQDASTWSQYAAIQPVDFNANSISNFGGIQFGDPLEWIMPAGDWIGKNGAGSAIIGNRKLYDENGVMIFDWAGTNGPFFPQAAWRIESRDIQDNTITSNQIDAATDAAYRNPSVTYCNSGTGCTLSASTLYAAWTVTLTGNWTVAISPAMTPGQQFDIEVAHSTSNHVITWPANVKAQKAGVSLSDTNTTGYTDWYTLKCRGTNSTTALATNLFKFTGIQ